MEAQSFIAVNKTLHISRKHKLLIDREVQSIGIHRTQHRILMYLAKKGNLPSQKLLAEHLEITSAAVTGALQKLEADGYIERCVGTDNRFNEIKITARGREIVERTKLLFARIDESMFVGFSKSELALYLGFLERIESNMEKTINEVKINEKMV